MKAPPSLKQIIKKCGNLYQNNYIKFGSESISSLKSLLKHYYSDESKLQAEE